MQDVGVFCSNSFSFAVLDEIPDLVQVIDGEGRLVFANSALKERFGGVVSSTCLKVPGASSRYAVITSYSIHYTKLYDGGE